MCLIFTVCCVVNTCINTKNTSENGIKFLCLVLSLVLEGSMTFHVMTDYGIVRSRVPIHMFIGKQMHHRGPLDHLQLWDCFHENVTVTEYDALFDCRAKVILKDGSVHWGDYVMTFDWYRNAYSNEPTQYKCLHMIALDCGNYALQPNNRIYWKNMSFVTKSVSGKS